jgi:hypothetical protein
LEYGAASNLAWPFWPQNDAHEEKCQMLGSPYKTVQVWKYRHVLLCKHLIFHHVLPEAIICNLLKLLTRIVL